MGTSNTGGALEGIAIIGMVGRFPQAPNLERFWENLSNGIESITFFTEEELLKEGVSPQTLQNPNYVRAAGQLEDIDLFDASFFGYNPREAEVMDPQQRIFLECAWEVLENAGYSTDNYKGRIGVYGGLGAALYLLRIYFDPQVRQTSDHLALAVGNEKDFLATRVSYKMNLKGPSFTVQTACSTSLVATYLGCQALN